MSNKERLLKERLYLAKKLIDSFIIFENLNDKDISLLVGIYKEAERVPELEEQNKDYSELADNLIGRLYEYENQIIRYREVLEFYADEDNYKEFYDLMRGRNVVMVLEDDGIKAHEALEGESNE